MTSINPYAARNIKEIREFTALDHDGLAAAMGTRGGPLDGDPYAAAFGKLTAMAKELCDQYERLQADRQHDNETAIQTMALANRHIEELQADHADVMTGGPRA